MDGDHSGHGGTAQRVELGTPTPRGDRGRNGRGYLYGLQHARDILRPLGVVLFLGRSTDTVHVSASGYNEFPKGAARAKEVRVGRIPEEDVERVHDASDMYRWWPRAYR